MTIKTIDAFQIFDSRGNPTIEAVVTLENGLAGHGQVPSGASTGQFEALELRDGDPQCFRGKSVQKAVLHVRGEIFHELRGCDVSDLRSIDAKLIALDGTPNKSRLGANAILGVSMATANAAAAAMGLPLFESLEGGRGTLLPLPEIQIFGGGAHAAWRTDLQDWLVIATGAGSFEEAMAITFEVFHSAGEIMQKRGKLRGYADEGGYWPEFRCNEEVFEAFAEAVEHAGFTLGKEASLSLDVAASDLYDPSTGIYRLRLDDKTLSSEEFMDQLAKWCRDYRVVSIEDPAADTDWEGWQRFYGACGHLMQVVGDDLFVTNSERIRQGIERQIANSVLIKLNQIGTVTETLDAIRQTQQAGWAPVVSARSGETEDTFISHLAVASEAGQLKVGSFCRGERTAKWNECLRIERQLGSRAAFAGRKILSGRR